MAPVAPTAAEKEAKKKAKAEKKNQAKADIGNQTKESGSPVVMNLDGSYTSLGALAPETPYVTSQEDKPIPSSGTNSYSQVLPATGISNPSLDSATHPRTVPLPASDAFKIPSKTNFDFALGASTTSLSSKAPATNGLKLPSKPTFGVTFGQGPISSSPQAPSTNIFNPVPTSTRVFDPMINPEARKLSFPAPNQPVNAPASVEGPSLRDVLKIINIQGSEATSIEEVQETNLLFKPFDLGMQMRHCHDNPDELNKCITVMEAKESLRATEVRNLEDELFMLQRKSRAARDAGIARLKEANSNIEAKDRCIVELEHDNEAIKAEAQSVRDQQAEQLAAKDEEIAELKATNTALETTNKKITEKAEEDIEKKDRWIAELRRNRQDADDRYKALVVAQDQEKLKFKRESEELKATIEGLEEAVHVKSNEFDDLRQHVKDANLKAKKAEDHARASDDRVEQQADALEENKATIGGLHATNQRLKKELQDYEEEMKSMTLEKANGSEDHRDCKTEIQRLEAEKKQEIDKLHRHYTIKHAEQAKHVEQEFVRVQEAQVELFQDLDKVRLRVQEDEHTINKLQQENRRLQSEVEDHKKIAAASLNTTGKGSVEPDTDKRQFLSSPSRGNELSEFSPASSPGPWRPQTESMMGDTDDSDDEGHHPNTLSYTGPVTVINFEPSDGPSDHDIATSKPVSYGLGIANVLCETYDQGTQTITPSSSPKFGISKIATIVDCKPHSPELSVSKPMIAVDTTPSSPPRLSISKPMTVINTTPSSPPKLDISKVSTIMDTKPSGPELSIGKPLSSVNETPSSPPKLRISKPMTIINNTPSPIPKLGISEPGLTVEFKPNSPKLSISKPITIVDNTPSSPIKLGLSKLETVIDLPPSAPKLSISTPMPLFDKTQSTAQKLDISKIATIIDSAPIVPELSVSKAMTPVNKTQPTAPKLDVSKVVTIIDSAPGVPEPSISSHLIIVDKTTGSAVVISTPDKQPSQKSLSRWRWFWYLLMLLTIAILTLAAFYGESARRERNMWLEANDFTRRAVYSVRAGGGTGTSVPAWLWNDQLLDLTKYYYR
ncbi:MAG: hypothetical protein L6R38_008155 [Xanthoria sp. 2 TBL-2021]|nr:MAG: hypothetical protein L6R38_008155 [Xanthoria sp. 2 TBL-2021]